MHHKQCAQCAKCVKMLVKRISCNDCDKTLKLSASLIVSQQTLFGPTDSKIEWLANIWFMF